MEHGQRPDPDRERERDEAAESAGQSVTPDEAVLAARKSREESGSEEESTSDIDKVRESGFGA